MGCPAHDLSFPPERHFVISSLGGFLADGLAGIIVRVRAPGRCRFLRTAVRPPDSRTPVHVVNLHGARLTGYGNVSFTVGAVRHMFDALKGIWDSGREEFHDNRV